jgi:hypothetical protein
VDYLELMTGLFRILSDPRVKNQKMAVGLWECGVGLSQSQLISCRPHQLGPVLIAWLTICLTYLPFPHYPLIPRRAWDQIQTSVSLCDSIM